MNPYQLAKWIWKKEAQSQDDYVSFSTSFVTKSRHLIMNISCDSIYAIYLNDKFIKAMQCSDYPFYKYYDEIHLDLEKEENILRIDVWHLGINTSNYYPSSAGVIFEAKDETGKVILFSNEKTPSRIMNEFHNGLVKRITSQLGLSFAYDNSVIKNGFTPSDEINKEVNHYAKRDIHNIDLLELPKFKIIHNKPSLLIDLEEETVGFPYLDFVSPCKQNILISFGEHIADGNVRRIIGERDFSFAITAKEGHNYIFNPLRRLAGRYIEVFYEKEIEVNYIGFKPVVYHHEKMENHFEDKLIQDIYDICVRTLECCMHEHYEDCPWREQALYVLDSRNQMLTGYQVFQGYEYQRHNLLLIAHDPMPLGLLSLCYPEKQDTLAIPMFSLAFILETYEYLKYTNDYSVIDEVRKPLDRIVKFFTNRIDGNGLIKYLEKPFWNFYEWVDGSDNADVFDPTSPKQKDQYDLIINAMYVYTVNLYNEMFNENIDTQKVKDSIQKTFYNQDKHLYKLNTKTNDYSQFGNSLAILIGLGDEITLEKVKACENMTEASLSVRGFVYDALLKNNKEEIDFVIKDIKKRYQKMLLDGATTVYETEEGQMAFDKAGSLCHGWSALPIHYFLLWRDIKNGRH